MPVANRRTIEETRVTDFSGKPKNTLHLYLTQPSGSIELLSDLGCQTLKLEGTRVVYPGAQPSAIYLFVKLSFIGPQQCNSNLNFTGIPILANSGDQDFSSNIPMSFSMGKNSNKRFTYSVVDNTGTIVSSNSFSVIQMIFSYEIDNI